MHKVVKKTTHVKNEVCGDKIKIAGSDQFYCYASRLLKGNGNNVFRSWFNQTHAYKDLNLHVVHGSLGFGVEKDVYYELGGDDRVMFKDFINRNTYDKIPGGYVHAVDLYCWLEDEEGKIYDVMESEWIMRALRLHKWVSLIAWREIRGKTTEELQRNHGLHYVKAANKDTQYLLRLFMEKHFRPQYDQFIRENPRLPLS